MRRETPTAGPCRSPAALDRVYELVDMAEQKQIEKVERRRIRAVRRRIENICRLEFPDVFA